MDLLLDYMYKTWYYLEYDSHGETETQKINKIISKNMHEITLYSLLSSLDYQFNIMGNKLLLNFGAKFQP